MVAAEGSAANSTSAIEGLYAQAAGDFFFCCVTIWKNVIVIFLFVSIDDAPSPTKPLIPTS